MRKSYKIEVDCAVCALKMEEAAKKVEGIEDAAVSFMTQKIRVEFADGADTAAVMALVSQACKKVEPDCRIFYQ
ncbi:MAG: cation transporter [Clostridium sp.]|jgi:copper chaperone CopZ|nr:cation transporter [Clostridium sp.]